MKKYLDKCWQIIEIAKKLVNNKINSISDGYHTFDELYQHRSLLFIAWVKSLDNNYTVWKSIRHHDGTWYDGYFLLCVENNGKQISYHLESNYWDLCDFVDTCDVSPIPFDGHTSQDVLNRLTAYIKNEY